MLAFLTPDDGASALSSAVSLSHPVVFTRAASALSSPLVTLSCAARTSSHAATLSTAAISLLTSAYDGQLRSVIIQGRSFTRSPSRAVATKCRPSHTSPAVAATVTLCITAAVARTLQLPHNRIRVRNNAPISQFHDARGILVSQLRVVGNHNYQALAGHLLQQVHHLHRRGGIQRAGGLVGQHNFGVIDQRTRNGHALHLPTRQLGGPLVRVLRQTHSFQGGHGAASSLPTRNPRKRKCQLHIGHHALVRDQVVALKHETHARIAVGVPVAVFVVGGGNAVDHQIA